MSAKAKKNEKQVNLTQKKFQDLLKDLKSQYVNRDREFEAILAAIIAKEHVCLLGPPGTAKSHCVRAVANALGATSENGDYFEIAVFKATTPDEIVGSIDLPKLKSENIMKRNTQGFLPTARIAFIDEIFKSNAASLNQMLAITNERVFHNCGEVQQAPLESMIAASNELPESDDLQAFYDRILVRLWIGWCTDEDDMKRIMFGDEPKVTKSVTRDDLEQARMNVESFIANVSGDFIESIIRVRNTLRIKEGQLFSDRRWKKTIRVLAAYAYITGSNGLSSDALELLPDLLWKKPEDRAAIARVVGEIANPSLNQARELIDAGQEVLTDFPDITTMNRGEFLSAAGKSVDRVKEICIKIDALAAKDKASEKMQEIVEQAEQLREAARKKLMEAF